MHMVINSDMKFQEIGIPDTPYPHLAVAPASLPVSGLFNPALHPLDPPAHPLAE
jgi:hypothetical protein